MSSIVERTAGELRGSITHLHKDCAQLQVKKPDTLVHRVWCVWTWDIYDEFSSIQEDPRCWWRLFSGYWVKSRHDSAPPKCFESKEPDNWNSAAISDLRYLNIFQTPSFLQRFSLWHLHSVHSGQNQGTQMVRIWVHTLKRHRLAAILGTSRGQKRETWLRSFLKALQKVKMLKPLG